MQLARVAYPTCRGSSASSGWFAHGRNACVRDDVESSQLVHRTIHLGGERGEVTYIDAAGDSPTAGRLDLGNGLGKVGRCAHAVRNSDDLSRDVDRDDARAFLREPHRVRATLPPSRAAPVGRARCARRAARARARAVTVRSPTAVAACSSAQRSTRKATVVRTCPGTGLAATASVMAVQTRACRWMRWARPWASRTRRSVGSRAPSIAAVTGMRPRLPDMAGMAKACGTGRRRGHP